METTKTTWGPEEIDRHVLFFARSGQLERICSMVSNGANIVDICEAERIRVDLMMQWLEGKPRLETWKAAERCWENWARRRIMAEVQRIATLDLRQAYAEDGSLLPVKDIPVEVARAIESIETEELFAGHGLDRDKVGVVRKVKFTSKLRALELMGKQLAMFVERAEVSHKASLEDILESMHHQPEPEIAPRGGNLS